MKTKSPSNLLLSKIYPAIISIVLVFALSPAPCALSQVPQGFNYQAIARDGSGNPIVGGTIDVRLDIQADTSASPVILWEELHSGVKTNAFGLFTVILGQGTRITGSATAFNEINWSVNSIYLKTRITYQSVERYMGSAKLWSVPYALVANDLGGPVKKLAVAGNTSVMDEALFEVKNKGGQTVFAVYNEGVRIYVADGLAKGQKGGFAIGGFGTDKGVSQPLFVVNYDSIRGYVYDNPLYKGLKGGFAIGGFSGTKASTNDYLLVSPDSVRIFVNNAPSTKGQKGGFAIGGFDPTKAAPQKLLTVSDDSIRMYIDDGTVKGGKGGFAIGSFDNTKGGNTNYLNVSTDNNGIVNPAQNRVLWYPLNAKNAFLAGRVLIEKPDSVGVNSVSTGYESRAKGAQSQAFGYKAIARGAYSTAIGYMAVAHKDNSFAFGENVLAGNTSSYAFGRGALAKGIYSFALGDGVLASKQYSYSFGRSSQSTGDYSVSMGDGAIASGANSFALGDGPTATKTDAYAFGAGAKATGLGSFSFGSVGRDTAGVQTGVYTEAAGDYSLAIGQGSRSLGTGAMSFGISNTSSGKYSLTLGTQASTTKDYGIAIGLFSSSTGNAAVAIRGTASGDGSFAIGAGAVTTGQNSLVLAPNYHWMLSTGVYNTEATAKGTIAMGTIAKASGLQSISIGNGSYHSGGLPVTYTPDYNEASGDYSIAIGRSVTAQPYASIALGRFNVIEGTKTSWVASEPLFVIGNGSAYNATNNAVTVLKNGAVGIGTPDPTATLHLKGNAGILNLEGTDHCFIQFYPDGIATRKGFFGFPSGASNDISLTNEISTGDIILTPGSSGFVGINTGTPAYDLDVVGTMHVTGALNLPDLFTRTVTTPRNLYCNAAGEIGGLSSSIKYKENVQNILNTDWLYQLRPVSFNYKNSDPSDIYYGLIAEEVAEINPSLIIYGPDNKPDGLMIEKLTAPMLKAIQDQKKEIKSLTEKVDKLEQIIEQLLQEKSGK